MPLSPELLAWCGMGFLAAYFLGMRAHAAVRLRAGSPDASK